jgi:hypothetical protein
MNLLQHLRMGRVQFNSPEHSQLDHCLCVPLSRIDDLNLSMWGGIFRSDGSFVSASGLINNGREVVGPGDGTLPAASKKLKGHSLYLGVCHYHYGHFLVETLSRIWGMTKADLAAYDHILLLPLNGSVPIFVWDLFRALGVIERVKVVSEPLSLETVTIPSPAIEYPQRVHRQIANLHLLFDNIPADQQSDQPLFLSRTDLVPGHHRVVVGEAKLERALANQGVRIFHPQHHPVMVQAAVLRKHRTIISFAGSALHTLMLTGGGHRVVAYSARKAPAVFPLIDLALGNRATYISAARTTLKGLSRMPVGFHPEIIDPRPVLRSLKHAGIIQRFDLGDYGTPEADASEVRRYNTALIMRQALEVSQREGDKVCHAEVAAYLQENELDTDMISQGCRSSELMLRFFHGIY